MNSHVCRKNGHSAMRLARWAWIVALLTAAARPFELRAQQPVPVDLAARIDSIFAGFGRTTPGCGVGLAKDGRPLYTHGYGSANLEYDIPNSDQTVFESGSVAKQFTASAVLLLQHDGKLDLGDDIRRYLPEVPAFGGQTITIRHLLTHTSGLRDQWGLLGIEGRGPGSQVHSPMTTLDLVAHQKMLNFPPGSRYLYSNTGYALAGIIVQRVSGKSLTAFTQERLFRPLGMTHTEWRDDFTRIVPNRATAYAGSAAAGFRQDMPFTNMVGNGGLLSTMGDLLKWNENLDHPTVGGPEYVKALETQMRLSDGRTIPYALGVSVGTYDGVREVSHSGSTAGYSTFLTRFPEQHVSVAVWCNLAGANATGLAHQVADLVLTKPARPATANGTADPVQLSRAELDAWAGLYRDESDQTLTLAAGAGSTLVVRRGNAAGTPVVPISATRFKYLTGEAALSGTPGNRTVVVSAAGDSAVYREVKPAPAVLETSDYTGTYGSDELDVQFTIVARGDKLFLQRRPYQEFTLQPVYADDFQSGGGLGTLRFARNTHGDVTGFSFFAGRVLDVRFSRRK
jgi:CubicO group peptidase (beta-lactamase class C family)